MYCKYCGKKIEENSSFCSGCGAKLSIAVKPEISQKKSTGHKKNVPQEDFNPTLQNIMGQFSPLGKVVFVALCILMVAWVAMLTFHTLYPELVGYVMSI